MMGYIFGGKGQPRTPEELAKARSVYEAMIMPQSAPKNIGEGLNSIGQSLAGALLSRQAASEAEEGKKLASSIPGLDAIPGFNFMGAGQAQPSQTSPTPISTGDQGGAAKINDISTPFLATLKEGGVTNPYALAAVGATGERESGWSPNKLNATWSDPSESGKQGSSGGLLSWRAERLDNLRNFAKSQGDQGLGSPATQAKFFQQENPALIQQLNSAKSPEEAMGYMNNNWRFAGYDRPGGERDARIAAANRWAGQIGGQPQDQRQPVQVASLGNGMPLGAPRYPMQATPNDGMLPNSPMNPQISQMQQGAPLSDPQPFQLVKPPQRALPAQAQQQQMQPAQQQSQSAPNLQQLAGIMNNPNFSYLSKPQQDMVKTQYEYALKQSDPQYQMQIANFKNQQELAPLQKRQQELAIQKAERELQTPRNTALSQIEDRKAAAQSIGIMPDDPAYQSYVATGKMPREDAQSLTATDKSAILSADETVAASKNTIQALEKAKGLSKEAYSGPLADWRASGMANVFGSDAAQKTIELNNVVTAQALESLKSTFGGAPTEGERKILLDIQGSVNQPPPVREAIYQRAIEAAQRRLKFNEDRANELRGGTYYKPSDKRGAPNNNQQTLQQTPGNKALSDPLGIR